MKVEVWNQVKITALFKKLFLNCFKVFQYLIISQDFEKIVSHFKLRSSILQTFNNNQ